MSIPRLIPIIGLLVLAPLTACQTDPVAAREQFLESARVFAEENQLEAAAVQYRNAVQVDPTHIPSRMALAETLAQLGQHQFAIQEYLAALEVDPEFRPAKIELAGYAIRSGEHARSAELLDEVLLAEPDDTDALLTLGNLQLAREDLENASSSFSRVLEIDPDNLGARINLAQVERVRGNLELARQTLDEAVRRHPDQGAPHRALGVVLVALGDSRLAEEHFRRAIANEPDDPENLRALLSLLQREGRSGEIDSTIEEAAAAAPDSVALQLAWVDRLRDNDRGEEALQRLEALAEDHPSDPQVLMVLTESYVQADRRDDAQATLNRLRNLGFAPGVVALLEGQVAQAQGRLDDALASYDKAIAANPDFLQAYLSKAQAQLARATPAGVRAAQSTLREALVVNSDSLQARALLAKTLAIDRSSNAEALVEAGKVLERDPTNLVAREAKAEALVLGDRLDEARADFEALIALRPKHPYYMHRLGTIAGLQARLPESREYFEAALDIEADYTDALTDLMVVYTREGDFEGALAALDRYAAEADNKDIFHVYRARIHLYRQDTAAARGELEAAIAANPDNFTAYQLLGQLDAAEGDVDAAIARLDKLLSVSPDNSGAHYQKGVYLQQAGRPEQAIAAYRRAVQIAPQNHMAANGLAWLLAERGENLSEAREMAQRARREQPDNTEYADTLGWVLYKIGNYTLALDQFLFTTGNGQPRAVHYYHLGMAYYRRGEPGDAGQARQFLEKALSMEGDFAGSDEAQRILAELGA